MKKYFLFLISGMLIMTSIYLLKNGFEIIGMSFYFTITMSIIGFSLGFWVLYKSFILSAQIDIVENDLDGNLIKKSNEEKFKSFFIEGKYEEFKSKAIENNILDSDLKWTFSKKGQKYPVVLFHFLRERKIIKDIEIKSYCEISNVLFGLSVNHTMYSKDKCKNLHKNQINLYYKEFLIFSE